MISCVLMLVWPTASHAWQTQLKTRLEKQPIEQVYQWLSEVSPKNDSYDDFHRWSGQIAMRLGDYPAAVEHFEQVVLLTPFDLGSRLELSIAYAKMRNFPASRASLAALYHYLGDRSLPPVAAERIAALRERLAASQLQHPEGAIGLASGNLSVAQGFDSNANQGSSQRTIPLNLWGEIPLELELADASMAKPSTYVQWDASLRMPLGAITDNPVFQGWQAVAGASNRHYQQLDSLDRRVIYGGGQWQSKNGRHQISLLGIHHQVDGLDNRWSVNANYRRLINRHWLASFGLEWQQEPRRPASHKLYLGLWAEWQQAVFWGRTSWQFRPERAAGDTWRMEIGVGSPVLHLNPLSLSAYATWEIRRDTQPYSPAFFGDERRNETTTTLGGLARLPLAESLDAILDVSLERMKSDLVLFERRRFQVETRLEWSW